MSPSKDTKAKTKTVVLPATGEPSSGKASRLSPKTKAALVTVAITAVERLSDPKVRAQLADAGRGMANQVKAWRAERTGGDGARSRAVRGLEQRAAKIRAAIERLERERPGRRDDLHAAVDLLDELDVAIDVADALPKQSRKEAIAKVDAELDRVERLVFDASLPAR